MTLIPIIGFPASRLKKYREVYLHRREKEDHYLSMALGDGEGNRRPGSHQSCVAGDPMVLMLTVGCSIIRCGRRAVRVDVARRNSGDTDRGTAAQCRAGREVGLLRFEVRRDGAWPRGYPSFAEDVYRLPFTTKDDLGSSYPTGLLAVDPEEVVRMHTSSGTTGKPVAILYTARRYRLLGRAYGAKPGLRRSDFEDVFQNMSGYGLFTGGLGLHFGAERLGMWVIPAGAGNTARHIMLIRDFHVTVIHATPSYAMHVAERMLAEGDDPSGLGLKIAALGAEPYTRKCA